MNKIYNFIQKWGFIAFLCVIVLALLFSLGCCIYTAIATPLVGIMGGFGTIMAIGYVSLWIYLETQVKKVKNKE